jgi:hypothetical protein
VAATQFARGALDYVSSGAALTGMAIEGAGELTGADWLRDFGRDFGRSASGGELMQAYMALPGMLTHVEGLENEALSDYERSQRTLHEQEEAWPMLSAVSHVGGAVAAGVGVGSLAAGHAALGTSTATAAVEGGAFGAQAGYAKNASLRDVATSALIGAAVGGGLTYGIGKGAAVLSARRARAAELTEALGTPEAAAARAGVTVEEAGGREAQSVIGELAKARKAATEAADAVQNPTVREQTLAAAMREQAEALAKKAGKLDLDNWARKPPNALQKVFHRSEILNKVSDDVVQATAKVAEYRPSLDVALNTARLGKLTKNADAPAAIGTLQSRVGELMGSLPRSVEADSLRFALRDVSSRLMKAELPAAMADAHELVRKLGAVALRAKDDTTRSFAERAVSSLTDDMASEAFGDAGKLYGQLIAGRARASRRSAAGRSYAMRSGPWRAGASCRTSSEPRRTPLPPRTTPQRSSPGRPRRRASPPSSAPQRRSWPRPRRPSRSTAGRRVACSTGSRTRRPTRSRTRSERAWAASSAAGRAPWPGTSSPAPSSPASAWS